MLVIEMTRLVIMICTTATMLLVAIMVTGIMITIMAINDNGDNFQI